MKSIDPAIKKETGYIALTALILSALLESVYLIAGRWDLSVLLGNVIGAGSGILNFFLMALGIQNALSKDKDGARSTVSFSHAMRFFLMALVLVLAACLDIFALIPAAVSLFFPTAGVYLRTLTVKKGGASQA